MNTVNQLLPENIVILNNISWQTFTSFLEDLGDQRNQRLSYNLGTLEIMTPSGEHENNNRFIESLIVIIADELNVNLKKFGSLTLKSERDKQAVEPDSCYYLTHEPLVRNKQNIDLTIDPAPDLVVEIDKSSMSLNKLGIYANLKVPEIWRYNGKILAIYILAKDGNSYQELNQSSLFPWLDITLIPELIKQSLVQGETATYKQFRQWLNNLV